MQKLIKEAEEEFEFQTEDRRIEPRVFIPEPDVFDPERSKTGVPGFLVEFIVDSKMLQPVKIKLDSVEIKGSKILAQHQESDYIQGTLYLMALAYFYRNEWVPSEIKCGELVDRFPDGEFAPDALILNAKALLIERKFAAGKLLLSRTVDIAWQLKRYDILSEAFRLEAELAIYEKDMDGALRPYKQAIAQADDELQKAKWQTDLAALLYRLGWFEKAEKEFALVHNYHPDYMAAFEADLYRANSLARINRTKEAEDILDDLENDGNNEEWLGYTYASRMNILRIGGKLYESGKEEKYADSAYMNHEAILAVYFERGMELYKNHDYYNAKKYFAKARNIKTDFTKTAKKMYSLLDQWNLKRNETLPLLLDISKGKVLNDTVKGKLALGLFELGRIHSQLGNADSSYNYYRLASDISPLHDQNTARYLYVWGYSLMDVQPDLADSIFEELATRYPITEYGIDARKIQGYTVNYITDTAAHFYHAGSQMRQNKQYDSAAKLLFKVYRKYPGTDYAPHSLYTLGWMFEKDLKMIDSALYFYQLLLTEYPMSPWARDIKLSVEYLLAIRSGQPLPDSLKDRPRRVVAEPPPIDPSKLIQEAPVKEKKKGSGDIFDMFDDPGEYLKNLEPGKLLEGTTKSIEDTKKKLLDPGTYVPDVKLPKDLFDDLKKSSDSTGTGSDTTKSNKKAD